jgi:hypothetical protein
VLVVAGLCAVLGFAVLAVSMERHHGQLLRRRGPSRFRARVFRLAGWCLLMVATGLVVRRYGAGTGLVAAAGLLFVAGLAVMLVLASLPHFDDGRPGRRG